MIARVGSLGLLFLIGASKPLVRFAPAPVPYAERSQMQSFDIHVRFGVMPATRTSVELTLDNGRGEPRTFSGAPTATDDIYRVNASLIPDYLHPLRLHVSARYSNGSVACNVEDTDLEVASQTIPLRSVRGGTGGHAPHLDLLDGSTIQAMPSVLNNLRGDLGPVAVTLNLALADSFTIEVIHPSLAKVSYQLKVMVADEIVAEQSGEIPITGTPGATAVAATQPVSRP